MIDKQDYPAFGGQFTHKPVEVTAAKWDGRGYDKLVAMIEWADPSPMLTVVDGKVTVGTIGLKEGDWYGVNKEGKFIVWSEVFFLSHYTPSKLLD